MHKTKTRVTSRTFSTIKQEENTPSLGIHKRFSAMLLALLFLALIVSSPAHAEPQCTKPNILLLLDKSGSMKKSDKWSKAKQQLKKIIDQFKNIVRFGLITFSHDTQLNVELGSDPNLISSALNEIEPKGETFIKPALQKANDHIKESLQNDKFKGRATYILLVTDGSPTDDCPSKEIAAFRSLKMQNKINDIKTFVVGFGVNINPLCLNNLALMGGAPSNVNNPKFFLASNSNSLNSSLNSIFKKTTTIETCNGIDDNCDGTIDKGPKESNLQEECRTGLCAGSRTCNNGQWSTCSLKTPKTKEICNGKDDDCNGLIDDFEGKPRALTKVCSDNCGTAINLCHNGFWGVALCRGKQKPETCNGKDDDCDGLVDEEINIDCSNCRFKTCSKGKFGACQPKKESMKVEVCNGIDDDCDGIIDNAPGDQREESLKTPCKNRCHEGFSLCREGRLQKCQVEAYKPEVCDGVDNNCNGQIDEQWQELLQEGKNSCQTKCTQGVYQCAPDGKGVICVGGGSFKEKCDGLDNDCNGKIDEQWAKKSKICSQGTGSCRQYGTYVCNATQDDVVCTAQSPEPPQNETCDGLDNDCDGKTDENLSKACKTEDGNGTQSCKEGRWGSCKVSAKKITPRIETDPNFQVFVSSCFCSTGSQAPLQDPSFLCIILFLGMLWRQKKATKQ
jgi:uncharacterized protein YegL